MSEWNTGYIDKHFAGMRAIEVISLDFYTASYKKRPVRLNNNTRIFARQSLQGRYGDDTARFPAVEMDDVPGFAGMTENARYDACIMKIAAEAPLRICEQELVSGAATLGAAIAHHVPAEYKGQFLWGSISHVTLGFSRVLKHGIDAIEAEIDEQLKNPAFNSVQVETLTGMKNAAAAMSVWHSRYLAALKTAKPEIFENLIQVPFKPARNFYEAVQSLWFTFAFTRLCGNWPGIGRIDEMLGGYLKQDVDRGKITLDEAREILASFFIKGCEWIRSGTPAGSGDAQHYQNIVLSGIDADGHDITNDVTYLVLDIIEELGISDFPVSVRINNNSPAKLLVRMAEVIRHGGGIVAVYNESLIIDSMTEHGYSLAEARAFANDGCWEIQVPGKTYFTYVPFDSLRILLDDTLGLCGTLRHFDSMDELYKSYKTNLSNTVNKIYSDTLKSRAAAGPAGGWNWSKAIPCPVVSLLTEGCAASGLSYLGGGAKYTVVSPHIGGAPDTGNSLYAIQKLVFEEKLISFDKLLETLADNWEGSEQLRQFALNRYTYYGNDNDEADRFTALVLNDFADIVSSLNGRCPIRFTAGVSTFGRQIEWAPFRAAVPFGFKKGEVLSGNASPTPGTDTKGATALINSFCKADLKKQASGAALDVILYPATVRGEKGADALISLMKGFIAQGGFFMQIDVVDAEVLLQAQKDPEKYRNLSVRVSGWNARFVTLNEEWQNMIIERAATDKKSF